MQTLMNEKDLININVKFEIVRKTRSVIVNRGKENYNKDMNNFQDLLDLKLGKIQSELNHAKEIKEGFSIIMQAMYHNRMNIGYQIILASNMEKLFADYLAWIKSLEPSDKFYDTMVKGLNEFTNGLSSDGKKLEDYFDLSKTVKVKEQKSIKGQIDMEVPKEEKEVKMENNVIDINFENNKPIDVEVNKKDIEEEITKEQIKEFVIDTKSKFNSLSEDLLNKYNSLKLKQWQMVAVMGNAFKMINNTKSSLYTTLNELIGLLLEGLETKKDLVYDSLIALVNEDLELVDFVVGLQTQFDKSEYLIMTGNLIKNFDKIKSTIATQIPVLLEELLADIVDEDKKIEIYLILSGIFESDLFAKDNILKLISEDVQKSSDNPEADLQILKQITEEKEVAQSIDVSNSIVNQQIELPLTFQTLTESSVDNDTEGESGYVVGGNIPIIIQEETK